MVTQELLGYIRVEMTKGRTREEINKSLLSGGGWSEDDLSEAFREIIPMQNNSFSLNTINSNLQQTVQKPVSVVPPAADPVVSPLVPPIANPVISPISDPVVNPVVEPPVIPSIINPPKSAVPPMSFTSTFATPFVGSPSVSAPTSTEPKKMVLPNPPPVPHAGSSFWKFLIIFIVLAALAGAGYYYRLFIIDFFNSF